MLGRDPYKAPTYWPWILIGLARFSRAPIPENPVHRMESRKKAVLYFAFVTTCHIQNKKIPILKGTSGFSLASNTFHEVSRLGGFSATTWIISDAIEDKTKGTNDRIPQRIDQLDFSWESKTQVARERHA